MLLTLPLVKRPMPPLRLAITAVLPVLLMSPVVFTTTLSPKMLPVLVSDAPLSVAAPLPICAPVAARPALIVPALTMAPPALSVIVCACNRPVASLVMA